MDEPEVHERHDPRVLRLKAALLACWVLVSFGTLYFARELPFAVGRWEFSYWMAAQGAVLLFIVIVAVYATVMKRLSPEDSLPTGTGSRRG